VLRFILGQAICNERVIRLLPRINVCERLQIGVEDLEPTRNLFDGPWWWEAATTLSHGAHQSDLCRGPQDLLWHLLRSLEALIGLCVAMIMQLSERNISVFIAFLVTSVRKPQAGSFGAKVQATYGPEGGVGAGVSGADCEGP